MIACLDRSGTLCLGLVDDAVLVDVLPYPLDLEKYVSAVGDPGAGGIATFLGVTRDNFQGKKVFQLEYEAYEPMARKIMKVRFSDCMHWVTVHQSGT